MDWMSRAVVELLRPDSPKGNVGARLVEKFLRDVCGDSGENAASKGDR
jgi:hypothetical protein